MKTFRLHRENEIIFETDESRGATPSPHSTWEKWFQELKTSALAPASTSASATPSTSASASVMPCLIMKWKPETLHCSLDQGFSVYCSPSQGRGSQTERLCSSAEKYILTHFNFNQSSVEPAEIGRQGSAPRRSPDHHLSWNACVHGFVAFGGKAPISTHLYPCCLHMSESPVFPKKYLLICANFRNTCFSTCQGWPKASSSANAPIVSSYCKSEWKWFVIELEEMWNNPLYEHLRRLWSYNSKNDHIIKKC